MEDPATTDPKSTPRRRRSITTAAGRLTSIGVGITHRPRATIPRLVITSRRPVTTLRGQERATGPTRARVGAITEATVVMGEETAVAAIMAGAAAGTGNHLFLKRRAMRRFLWATVCLHCHISQLSCAPFSDLTKWQYLSSALE